MTHDELERRLANWGIAMRPSAGRNHCRSIEHRYEPERILGESWDIRRAPRLLIDHKDADRVEHAWRRLKRPTFRQLLRLHYVYRYHPGAISRLLGIQQARNHHPFREALGLAQADLADALEPTVCRATMVKFSVRIDAYARCVYGL